MPWPLLRRGRARSALPPACSRAEAELVSGPPWMRSSMSWIVDQIALRASTLMSATETARSAADRRLIRPGSAAISVTKSRPSTMGSTQRGAKRKSSGRRRVSTIAATTAAAIGQPDSAYADSREAGSIGSVPSSLAMCGCCPADIRPGQIATCISCPAHQPGMGRAVWRRPLRTVPFVPSKRDPLH